MREIAELLEKDEFTISVASEYKKKQIMINT